MRLKARVWLDRSRDDRSNPMSQFVGNQPRIAFECRHAYRPHADLACLRAGQRDQSPRKARVTVLGEDRDDVDEERPESFGIEFDQLPKILRLSSVSHILAR